MLFWFIAFGVIGVALVFDSRGVDFRFVAAGSILPLLEVVTGSPWFLHTLVVNVGILAVVMFATAKKGRKLLRRQWLGLPIGLMMFLIAAGVWQRTELIGWPFFGVSKGIGEGKLPAFDRPLVVLLILELAGIATLVWFTRTRQLNNPSNRRIFYKTGRLPPRPEG